MNSNDNKLVNRVANSKLKTINLEQFYPTAEIMEFDLRDYLFKELILREKDFRTALKEIDWTVYENKVVTLYCSTDAIIPTWAYMLVSSYLSPYAAQIFTGTKREFIDAHYRNHLATMDYTPYQDQLIVIKGCSQKPVPTSAYVALTAQLTPIAKSIMYGEACSTVPIYKKPKYQS